MSILSHTLNRQLINTEHKYMGNNHTYLRRELCYNLLKLVTTIQIHDIIISHTVNTLINEATPPY